MLPSLQSTHLHHHAVVDLRELVLVHAAVHAVGAAGPHPAASSPSSTPSSPASSSSGSSSNATPPGILSAWQRASAGKRKGQGRDQEGGWKSERGGRCCERGKSSCRRRERQQAQPQPCAGWVCAAPDHGMQGGDHEEEAVPTFRKPLKRNKNVRARSGSIDEEDGAAAASTSGVVRPQKVAKANPMVSSSGSGSGGSGGGSTSLPTSSPMLPTGGYRILTTKPLPQTSRTLMKSGCAGTV